MAANIAAATTSVGTAGETLSARQTSVVRVRRRREAHPAHAVVGAWRRTRRRRARRRPRRDRHHLRAFGRPRRWDPVDHHHGRRRHRRRPGHDDHRRPGVGQTGQPTPTRWGGRRPSSHDAVGRRTKVTTPGGLVTATAYTPTQTTVTTPDGRVTRKHRRSARSDRVDHRQRPQRRNRRRSRRPVPFGSQLQPRRLRRRRPTDQAGRSATTMLDAFGRTVSQEGRPGSPTSSPTTTVPLTPWSPALVPDGATQPSMSTSTSYDDADRAIQSQTTYCGRLRRDRR